MWGGKGHQYLDRNEKEKGKKAKQRKERSSETEF